MSDAAGNIVKAKKKSFKKKWIPKKKTYVTKAQVKRMIARKAELKYFDLVQTATGVSSSGSVWDLSAMTQAAGLNHRIGDEITTVWLEIQFASAIADSTNFMRYVVFIWNNDTAGVTPTLAAVLANGNDAQTLQHVVTNAKDTIVLLDVVHKLSAVSNPTERTRHIIGLKNKIIEYTDNATTGNKHLYLAAVSDSTAVAHPTVEFASRLAFRDS